MTYLSALGADFLLHLDRIREMLLIPIKVPMFLCILDIQPRNVQRDILFIESTLHLENIGIIDIIPSTLVVSQCPLRRKIRRSRQTCVLLEERSRIGTWQDQEIHDPGFRHPVGLDTALCVHDIDERFRCDEGKQSDGMFGVLGVDEGDGAVECHRGIVLVFENIHVPKSVRLGVSSATPGIA